MYVHACVCVCVCVCVCAHGLICCVCAWVNLLSVSFCSALLLLTLNSVLVCHSCVVDLTRLCVLYAYGIAIFRVYVFC